MKHLKTYESINNDKPKVGDYVIIKYKNEILPTIAKVTFLSKQKGQMFPYLVDFDDNFYFYDYGLDHNSLSLDEDEIIYWSKDKKELEHILTSTKYNL